MGSVVDEVENVVEASASDHVRPFFLVSIAGLFAVSVCVFFKFAGSDTLINVPVHEAWWLDHQESAGCGLRFMARLTQP